MNNLQEGQIRIRVSTLLEVVGKAVLEVEGVKSNFEHLLRQTKVFINGEGQSVHEKIPLEGKGITVTIALKLAESSSFIAVAREVQKRVWETVRRELGLSLDKVNIEVNEIEWF
ncbi:MAG: Asp23/Gls24 family envelope stress response protein [Candidatus Atribacteria bacterium]|nr:Asp23/Gls24 family envelope stress response protein [Candidatus Atribacteria bacterium]